MAGYQKILIPLDGSKLAEGSLRYGVAIAYAPDAELILLSVIPPLLRDIGATKYEDMAREVAEERMTAYLHKTQNRIRIPSLQVKVETAYGPVAKTILAYAEEEEIDLIIITTHGHSGVSRWLLGSVAEKLVRQAACPVMVCPARTESEES